MSPARTANFKQVSHSVTKVDAKQLALGKDSYVGDFAPPNALIVKMLGSPHPHARIISMDVSRAEKMPGVVLAEIAQFTDEETEIQRACENYEKTENDLFQIHDRSPDPMHFRCIIRAPIWAVNGGNRSVRGVSGQGAEAPRSGSDRRNGASNAFFFSLR